MPSHHEHHRSSRAAWLRASVLGANDGIVSTASLVAGVAAADVARGDVLVAGVAALVAGAMSMAAGEYVSVRSEADLEAAELEKERRELERNPEGELTELVGLLEARGLERELAHEVAVAMTRHDALGAHATEELGITPEGRARPLLAAASSALAFALGAALPLGTAVLAPVEDIVAWVIAASLVSLAALGLFSAKAGGASPIRAAVRVTFWGALAMGLTAAIGHVLGVAV